MGGFVYPNAQVAFQHRFEAIRRDEVVGVLLAFFLGCFGAHHFYLGRVGWGLIYVLFCWTGIPAMLGVIECFFMPSRVRAYNAAQAAGLAAAMGIGFPGWIGYPVAYAGAPMPYYEAGNALAYQQGGAVLAPTLLACRACGRGNPGNVLFCAGCGAQI